MARSRNIKPGFFTNDVLSEVQPLGRLLFAGLWTLADREGRLECRVKRIKAAVLPYDECDVDALLTELQMRDFILRYAVGKDEFIQVLNFAKHQNPHKNESESEIPAPEEIESAPENIGTRPEEIGSAPADSLLLIPDSLSTDVQEKHLASKSETPGFQECWEAYPKRAGGNSRKEAEKVYRARLKSGVLPADLLAGVQRYAAFIRATGKEGTAYVKQASTFFGSGEHWLESWAVLTETGDQGFVPPSIHGRSAA